MSIDDRLRADLPATLGEARPDVDAELAVLLDRVGLRSRVRRTAYAAGLFAAAVVAAVTLGQHGDAPRGFVDPVQPTGEVRVLEPERGSSADPAPLAPGRYAIPFIGATADAPWGEVEVPTGWGQDRLILATSPNPDPHLRRVELLAVDRVAADPCDGNMYEVRPRVADVVSALTQQQAVQPSAARPVSIDGYSGQLLHFRVPWGLDVEKCWDGASLRPLGLAGSWISVIPGWTYRTWVLDVAGDPLVIFAAHGPDTTPSELAELTAIVQGITFVEPR